MSAAANDRCVPPAADGLSPNAAVEELARHLHDRMEQLHPTEDDRWDMLDERRREFYISCVKYLLAERDLIRVACQNDSPR